MSFSSRIPGFYRLTVNQRREQLSQRIGCNLGSFASGGIDLETADGMIENVVGTYALPVGLALNFLINDRDYLVPLVVEEPSVVAAASNAARIARSGGGFRAESDPPIMIGQIQLTNVTNPDGARARILAAKSELLATARTFAPGLVQRGGGPCDLAAHVLSRPGEPDGGMIVVHIHVDCRDAMGANVVNTIAEALAPDLARLADGRIGLRILTNLADERCVRVSVRVPSHALDCEAHAGHAVKDGIVAASRFAELDPYRAATHNKGLMNGVDAVLLATGNDWRGVEAGAHAFAAKSGRYAPLAVWRSEADDLVGQLAMPMAVGTIGGSLQAHPGAQLSLAILGVSSATELACVVGAVGLASNLAALRALATYGIQRGHMSLHARVVARTAGATGELLEQVAHEIATLGDIRPERARLVLARLERLDGHVSRNPAPNVAQCRLMSPNVDHPTFHAHRRGRGS